MEKIILIGLLIGLVGCAGGSKAKGVVQGSLAPCGNTPNCVSTEGPAKREIRPLWIDESRPFSVILRYMQDHYLVDVVERSDDYMHLVITTPTLRFKDDVEFLRDRETGLIEMRSASRVGYSDLGVNRKRLEGLRAFCEAKFGPQPVGDKDKGR